MEALHFPAARRVPWNKGRLTGQKPPLKLREIRTIRTKLLRSSNARELALFNLAIDSKLRACDLTRLQVQDVCMRRRTSRRASMRASFIVGSCRSCSTTPRMVRTTSCLPFPWRRLLQHHGESKRLP